MNEGDVIVQAIEIAADHPAFEGHFPGRPVLPGVALLALVLEAAARDPRLKAYTGAALRLPVVKFLGFVGPGASLALSFRAGARALEWHVRDGDRAVAAGQIGRSDGVASTA